VWTEKNSYREKHFPASLRRFIIVALKLLYVTQEIEAL